MPQWNVLIAVGKPGDANNSNELFVRNFHPPLQVSYGIGYVQTQVAIEESHHSYIIPQHFLHLYHQSETSQYSK